MPAPTNDKTDCPHCHQPYYPNWAAQGVSTSGPSRQTSVTACNVWATTCTSCDKPVVRLEPKGGDAKELFPDWDFGQVFPVEPEVAIEIVIQVFIDFEKRQASREQRTSNVPPRGERPEGLNAQLFPGRLGNRPAWRQCRSDLEQIPGVL